MLKKLNLKGIVFLLIVLTVGSLAGALVFKFDKKPAYKAIAGSKNVDDPVHPVEIYYGSAALKSLKEMAENLLIEVYPEDKVSSIPPPEMGLGSKLTITRASKVEVVDAKVSKIYRTWAETVGSFLKENNIELLGKDSVNPDINSKITHGLKIAITRVAEIEVTQKEPIDFKVIKKNSADLEKGLTEIETKGSKGEKEVTYIIKRVDGEEVSRVVKESKVLTEPTSEVVIVGIGPKYAKSGPHLNTINAAAKKYLINGTALMCLMLRESGGTADTGYPDAQYKGLFQYTDGYWEDASAKAGYSGASIYDAEAQIYTTAYELTHGQSRRWPPWRHCSDK